MQFKNIVALLATTAAVANAQAVANNATAPSNGTTPVVTPNNTNNASNGTTSRISTGAAATNTIGAGIFGAAIAAGITFLF
ncbi:hypothetical protein NCAS_0A00260 [Naumovozyma castellii]|uniref:Uncharacterized protein n=1 Tax=Naumovozyma castellii TaxID=27288 RepID=G0V551_NAUCA|nr:hypothetical protein NCAS_0A00260 [Naumovozyma castellii CBS 4309]CCC66587.1 hypothetical protein NCAS_0A00260 [Naumovozyma castellii CBS 4309]